MHDKHTAEDIVQSIFIQLWENDKILGLDNPEPYLLRCVKYKSIDYLRSPKRKQEVSFDKLPEIGSIQSSSIEEGDIIPMMTFFAAKLPTKMQEVFLLSRQNKLSYKEIAEKQQVSIKTIENQMGTALKKLRQLLTDHGYLAVLFHFF